jgi:hypothetical protein
MERLKTEGARIHDNGCRERTTGIKIAENADFVLLENSDILQP